MLAESHPLIRRTLRFLALPYCYVKLVNWQECTLPKSQVLKDLLYIFFKLKYFPDNYSPCRLWEKDKTEWYFYYGSSYHPYQRSKLRKEVQRFEYIYLFDNKEISELICRGIGVKLPKYYGAIWPEMNYRKKIEETVYKNERKKIIIKPIMGQEGKDISLAYVEDGQVKVKLQEYDINLSDFHLKERSIMQEVVVQDSRVAKISSSSVNTIRAVTLYTKSNEAIVISSIMRFGVGKAYIDNWSAGGVAVGVDHEKGELMKTAYDKKGKQYVKHPTTGVTFEGFRIPHWGKVLKLAKDVQEACSFFKMLGLDIGISLEGPILIEVNPNPDIILQEQAASPLLKHKGIYEEFEKYDLFVNKFQRNLYK